MFFVFKKFPRKPYKDRDRISSSDRSTIRRGFVYIDLVHERCHVNTDIEPRVSTSTKMRKRNIKYSSHYAYRIFGVTADGKTGLAQDITIEVTDTRSRFTLRFQLF